MKVIVLIVLALVGVYAAPTINEEENPLVVRVVRAASPSPQFGLGVIGGLFRGRDRYHDYHDHHHDYHDYHDHHHHHHHDYDDFHGHGGYGHGGYGHGHYHYF